MEGLANFSANGVLTGTTTDGLLLCCLDNKACSSVSNLLNVECAFKNLQLRNLVLACFKVSGIQL